MEQPKKELKLTKEEQERNASVTMQSTSSQFKDNAKEMQKLEVDSEGKATPIVQKRKIQIAKPGSGKKTRIIGEDGSVLYELEPGSDKEKAMLQKIRLQEKDTNIRRQKSADVMNYQTGDTEGNRVYDEKLKAQGSKKVIIKK
jgi:hypothetical protein